MTKQHEQAKELAQQYAHATSGMVGASCGGALKALRTLADDKSSTKAISRMHAMTAFARRAQDDLSAGETRFQNGEIQDANLQWANALVLMDALAVDANNILDNIDVNTAVDLQKSGKTG